MLSFSYLARFATLLAASALAQTDLTSTTNSSLQSVVSIPAAWTYLLPDGFIGNVNTSFVNGTITGNSTIDSALSNASQSPFIACDPEFLDIFGSNPNITLVEDRTAEDGLFAFEAGVWVPEKDEVWFTSASYQAAEDGVVVSIHKMNTSIVETLNTTDGTLQYPNGGYYFQGKVYFATFPSNTTYRGGIVSVDVETHQIETVVNSYFGLPFLSTDDLVWATRGNNKYLYLTDYDFSFVAWKETAPKSQLPSGVWRFDPQEGTLLPVIGRNEVAPNGVRVSPDQRTLYVTGSSPTYDPRDPSINTGGGDKSWLGPYIYAYELDDDMFPVNRRTFGLVREYIADGIHVDDAGRVWTAEGEGIVVRSPKGKVLGLVNTSYFLADKQANAIPVANFALAGDKLVIGATTRLYTVQLAKEIVSRTSTIVN